MSLLQEAEELINGVKAADYGPPLQSFDNIAKIASVGLAHKLTEDLTAEDICWVLLFALKGSRAAQGLRDGAFHRDTYADAAGYAGCAEKIHNEREAEGSIRTAAESWKAECPPAFRRPMSEKPLTRIRDEP